MLKTLNFNKFYEISSDIELMVLSIMEKPTYNEVRNILVTNNISDR